MKPANKFLKDYRRMFRLLKDGGTFTVFDTETTGLKAETCRIIEIGAIRFNQDGILGKFTTLINPQEKIPYQITQITGIDDRMVQDSPVFSEIEGKFEDFIKDTILIGHNVQFDLRFMNAELERIGKSPLKNQAIDTLQFARWAFPEMEKYNQIKLAEYFGINITSAHRAWDDAFVCGNIFLHLIEATSERQR